MVRWMKAALAVGTLLVGTLVATAAPASAGTASCFHTMDIKNGTKELRADWDGDGHTDQCFALKQDRTVWNVWRGADRWYVMPHNGRADQMCDWGFDRRGWHSVRVWVASNNQVYGTSYDPGSRQWLAWEHLPGAPCPFM